MKLAAESAGCHRQFVATTIIAIAAGDRNLVAPPALGRTGCRCLAEATGGESPPQKWGMDKLLGV